MSGTAAQRRRVHMPAREAGALMNDRRRVIERLPRLGAAAGVDKSRGGTTPPNIRRGSGSSPTLRSEVRVANARAARHRLCEGDGEMLTTMRALKFCGRECNQDWGPCLGSSVVVSHSAQLLGGVKCLLVNNLTPIDNANFGKLGLGIRTNSRGHNPEDNHHRQHQM